MEGSKKERTVIGRAVDTALFPFHAAVSKPAQKAYLSTFLFVTASLFLFAISSVSYVLFYYNYVPQVGVERVIHLQFGNGNPHGSASFPSALTSLQAYDISLLLHLPRTPNNLAAGNFMLDLSLLSSPASAATLFSNLSLGVLASSRRPAILTYASPIIDTASTIGGLPWYILGWKRESEVLEVGMFEGIEFGKGWKNLPQSAKIVIEADEKMQFYELRIKMVARFSGLRWLLYHHRIFSFLFFITAFWTSSMFSALFVWLLFNAFSSSTPTTGIKSDPETNGKPIKSELSDSDPIDPFSTEDLSDTSRSFPTLGRQMPLHFTRKDRLEAGIKKEGKRVQLEDLELQAPLTGIQPFTAEADDEDEAVGDGAGASWRDSGIGTSLDDGYRSGAYGRQRRRYTLDR